MRLKEGHWAGDLSRVIPEGTLHIQEHMPIGGGRGRTSAYIADVASDQWKKLLEVHSGIEDVEIREQGEEIHLVLIITRDGGGFPRPLRMSGLIPKTPFQVSDGWVRWEFDGPSDRVKHLIDEFQVERVPHRIRSIGTRGKRLLTERQRYIFDRVMESGYYEYPRRTNLTQLAERLDTSTSSLSETLMRIEKRVMQGFQEDIRRRS